MYYIVLNNKVICDSSNFPREFGKRKKAQNFIDGRGNLLGAQVVDNIKDYKDKLKVPI